MNWDTLPEKYAGLLPEEDQLKRDEHRAQGLANKREGEAFEFHIEAALLRYKEAGTAEIEKTPEPIKQIGRPNRKGQFLAVYTKRAQPDFKGTISGGRSIVFEAKSTRQDKISQSAVTEDQRERLEHHNSLGALTFVIVAMGLDNVYRVPWETWRDMKQIYGHKSMNRAELEPFRIDWRDGMIQLLDGIEKGATP